MTEEQRESTRAAILEQVLHTAKLITEFAKEMPRTGKKKRNIFIKSYNRRPMNKRKRNLAAVNITLATYMGAASIARIKMQPIPRYPLAHAGTASGQRNDNVI